jgi:hypothetical protein
MYVADPPVEIRTLGFGPLVGVDLGGLKSRHKDLDQRLKK